MKNRKLFAHVAMIAVLGLTLAACGSDDGGEEPSATDDTTAAGADSSTTATSAVDLEPISVTYLAGTESLASLVFLQALDAEYFTEEGVDLDYLPLLPNSAQIASTVASGGADIGSIGSDTGLTAFGSAGLEIVGLATQARGKSQVLTLSNDAIQRAEEAGVTADSPVEDRFRALEGMTIAVTSPTGPGGIPMVDQLQQAGLDPESDVTLVSIGDPAAMIAALNQGQIDGMFFSIPASLVPEVEGNGQVWISFVSEIEAYASAPLIDVVASSSYAASNPEAIERFLSAMWRAWEDINERPEEVRAGIKERFFPDLDPTTYDAAFDEALNLFAEGLVPTPDEFELVLTAANSTLEQPFEATFDDYYDPTFAENSEP